MLKSKEQMGSESFPDLRTQGVQGQKSKFREHGKAQAE